ncbi:hypothetical protein AKO1_000767 [Acrasis kona]|uniref:Uncharacterized protein n=1 Tax=Acrasis kona TaxID=1008807 RepID=A0AAW2ZC74_9EUKA
MGTFLKSPEGQYKLAHEYKAKRTEKDTKITRRSELISASIDVIEHADQNETTSYVTLNSPGNITFYNLTKQGTTKILSCSGAVPICHKINRVSSFTKEQNLDIIVGFSTGDIAIVTQKSPNLTFNANKVVDKTGVKCVSWGPPSNRRRESDLFLAGHESGNVYVYNKMLLPSEEESLIPPDGKYNENQFFAIQREVRRVNPISRIRTSNAPITDIKFSPNGQLLAVASMDGHLYVIDFVNLKLHLVFQSFYGAVLCCCWSPDARYIVTGGEDDLISVYNVQERCILARGRGHSSYVSKVTFDTDQCDSDRYRIVSAGQDTRLILWDIDKQEQIVDGAVDIIDGKKKQTSTAPKKDEPILVRSRPQNEVPYFEPVGVKAHADPLRDVITFSKGIITICNQGVVRLWSRPSKDSSPVGADYVDESGQEEEQQELHHNDLDLELMQDDTKNDL